LAAGIEINWDDLSELSSATPLMTRIYPNGSADVNHFHAAGGMGFLTRELLEAGLLHGDIATVGGESLAAYAQEPFLAGETVSWRDAPSVSGDESVLRGARAPFSKDGGLRLMAGGLGRACVKVSAVADDKRMVEAPAVVFDTQAEIQAAFKQGDLDHDCVIVVRGQGPRANGMPELHKLMPLLGALQDRGFRVALVTDGRMSGASGKVLAAIHVTPEAAEGGPLAKVRNGDVLRVDANVGALDVVSPADWRERAPAQLDIAGNARGLGRELFSVFRAHACSAERGGSAFPDFDPA
jgi:phosphogluconate dehydratase